MKRPSVRGFTLVEMLTVMAVIAVLASLIVAVMGVVQRNAAAKRAESEIATLTAQLENYRADNGEYPRKGKSDDLDPRLDGNPATGKTAEKYEDANMVLYSALSGDKLPDKDPDGKPEDGEKIYFEFKRDMLKTKKDEKDPGKIAEVKFIQDPWGNAYGYSTARAKAEAEFNKDLRKDPTTSRPKSMPGYNPTFDLWSTGGSAKNQTLDGQQADAAKWVKNW